MSKQTINIGASPNDGTGTPLRTSFDYTNQNFTEIYTALGGGVALPGATTQVIFNDGGTNLAGDAGLVYNKTTDALTVAGLVTAGSATITGDLTVRTNKLKVDATGVAIGATSAAYLFDVRGTDTTVGLIAGLTKGIRFVAGASTLRIEGVDNTGAASYQPLSIGGSALDFSLSGTTAMTLNSTGLGIGVAPVTDCKLTVRGGSIFDRGVGGGSPQLLLSLAASSGGNYGQISNTGTRWALGFGGTLTTVGTEALVWDSSGNVGIGVTPTTAWRAGARALQVGVSKYVSLHEQSNGSTNLAFSNYESAANVFSYTTGDAPSRYAQINGAHQWYSAAAGTINTVITFGDPKMTLDAAGKLNIGNASGDVGLLFVRKDSLTDQVVQLQNEAATGKMITFHTNGNNQVGSISFTSSAVAYNTSSDYRLKESVKPISGGLARVNALKPSAYKWKVDGSNGEGFLAHELAEVVPFAVTGDKDAVDVDSKPAYQGVDLSKIVPILVAAIQELTAEVNALKNA